ncbi:MAG: hypothetical protein ACR2NK_09635 [Mariniblastus sp.]
MQKPEKFVCAGCTLLCDDIEIDPRAANWSPKNTCALGSQYFAQPLSSTQTHFVDGETATLEQAVQSASQLLRESKSPLICGLDQLSTEAQQASWKIADISRATIDTTFTNRGRSSIFSLQKTGKVTATLGEIKSRSDLIIFWFCDPEVTHPRLLERINPQNTNRSQRILVVGDQETATTKIADRFIQVSAENAFELLVNVRSQLASLSKTPTSLPAKDCLSDIEITANELVKELVGAKYGSILYQQVTENSQFDPTSDSISELIRSLNDITRFIGLKLRTDDNAQSAENVLAWSSGFPFAVNHNLGHPRQHGLEFSAESMLQTKQCDAILFASRLSTSELVKRLSGAARTHFQAIPKIAFSTHTIPANVQFQMGIHGINEAGERCRLDNLSLPLKKVEPNDWVPPEAILEKIRQNLLAHL